MKTLSTLFIVVLFFYSCTHGDPFVSMYELGVDFQGSFENDHVKLVMGGNEMLNRNLETNNLLGVCTDGGQLSLALPEGEHEMTVTINHSITKTETVLLNRPRYVGINYNRQTHEISFQVSDEPFAYD